MKSIVISIRYVCNNIVLVLLKCENNADTPSAILASKFKSCSIQHIVYMASNLPFDFWSTGWSDTVREKNHGLRIDVVQCASSPRSTHTLSHSPLG